MRKVLIVEDEEKLRRNVCTFLAAREGLEPVGTATAEEAMAILKTGTVDVLVTDIRLPGMDGVELIRLARRLDPGLPVLVITAFGSEDTRRAAYRHGAMRFMEKPLDLERLAEAVKAAMEERRDGWRGHVGGLDLYDLAQLLALSRKRRAVEVRHGDRTGTLVFDRGELVFAATDTHQGDEAFFEMVRWQGGRFSELPEPPSRIESNVTRSLASLLMEAARLQDEGAAGLAAAEPEAGAAVPAGAAVEDRNEDGAWLVRGEGRSERWGGALCDRFRGCTREWQRFLAVVTEGLGEAGLGSLVRCRLLGTGGGLGYVRHGPGGPEYHVLLGGPVTAGRLTIELDALGAARGRPSRNDG